MNVPNIFLFHVASNIRSLTNVEQLACATELMHFHSELAFPVSTDFFSIFLFKLFSFINHFIVIDFKSFQCN